MIFVLSKLLNQSLKLGFAEPGFFISRVYHFQIFDAQKTIKISKKEHFSKKPAQNSAKKKHPIKH